MVTWLVAAKQVYWKSLKRHVMLFDMLYPVSFPTGYQGAQSLPRAQRAVHSATGVLNFSIYQHNELMLRLSSAERTTSFAAFRAGGGDQPSAEGPCIAVAATLGFYHPTSASAKESMVYAATSAIMPMTNCVLTCSTQLSYAVMLPARDGVDCFTPFGGVFRAKHEPNYAASANEALRNSATMLTPDSKVYLNCSLNYWQQSPPADFVASTYHHEGVEEAAKLHAEELEAGELGQDTGSLAAALAAREQQRLAAGQSALQRQRDAELATLRAHTAQLVADLAAARSAAEAAQAASLELDDDFELEEEEMGLA